MDPLKIMMRATAAIAMFSAAAITLYHRSEHTFRPFISNSPANATYSATITQDWFRCAIDATRIGAKVDMLTRDIAEKITLFGGSTAYVSHLEYNGKSYDVRIIDNTAIQEHGRILSGEAREELLDETGDLFDQCNSRGFDGASFERLITPYVYDPRKLFDHMPERPLPFSVPEQMQPFAPGEQ